jgi:hypothetical protein
MTGQHGKALKKIAMPFRNEVKPDDQSYDLMGMALSNRFVSRNYKEKQRVSTDLEVMKDLMAERNVNVISNGKSVMQKAKNVLGFDDKDLKEVNQQITGRDSNSFKLLEGIIEDRLYGISEKAQSYGGISMNKVADTATKIAAHNMLILNGLGAGVNVMSGKTSNFFESVRGVHYTKKNLLRGERKYAWDDLKDVISDVGRVGRPKDKINLLIEKFLDSSMDWSGISNHLSKDTRFKQLLNMGTLHGFNGMAEHYIQGTLVYAMLDNMKVVNAHGQYVNSNGDVVKNREDAMTADEAYEITDKGTLRFRPGLSIEGGDGVFTKKTESNISRKIKDVTADLQGNYDARNKSQIQREWYGRLGTFLRKWMVRGTQNRWRGVEHTGKKWKDISEYDKFWSEASQEYKEGTYVSALRFANQMRWELLKFQSNIRATEWDKLTDMEKGNIKKALTELLIMAGSFVASGVLAGLAAGAEDDNEKEALYTGAYLTRRLYGELSFYLPYNPMEAIRVMRTPTATLSTAELVFKAFAQSMEDAFSGELERYQKGDKKGESKTWAYWSKVFNPIKKNLLDRDVEKSLNFIKEGR